MFLFAEGSVAFLLSHWASRCGLLTHENDVDVVHEESARAEDATTLADDCFNVEEPDTIESDCEQLA